MSQFLPERPQQQQGQPKLPEKGPEDYLSSEERQFLTRIMSYPEDLPPKFKSWLLDHIAVNGLEIPVSQIRGFSQYTATRSGVVAGESTSSTTYTNLTTTGPEISGLSDGTYLLIFGFHTRSGNPDGYMSVSVNGATAVDADAAYARFLSGNPSATPCTPTMTLVKTISNNNNNTITAKYRVSSSSLTFENRWMVTVKISN